MDQSEVKAPGDPFSLDAVTTLLVLPHPGAHDLLSLAIGEISNASGKEKSNHFVTRQNLLLFFRGGNIYCFRQGEEKSNHFCNT